MAQVQGWYYEVGNKRVGPLSLDEVRQQVAVGKLSPYTMLQQVDGPRMAASLVLQRGEEAPPRPATQEEVATIVSEEPVPAPPVVPPPPVIPLPPPPPDAGPCLPPPPPDAPVGLQVSVAAASAADVMPEPTEVGRMRYWARLREVARWQRTINTACASGVAFFGIAKALGSASGSDAVNVAMGVLASIAVTAFWVWLIVNLAQTLDLNVWVYGLLGIVPGLNFLLLLQLSGRATARLKNAGIGVGFLGTKLPEQPPAWFQAPVAAGGPGPLGASPFASIPKP